MFGMVSANCDQETFLDYLNKVVFNAMTKGYYMLFFGESYITGFNNAIADLLGVGPGYGGYGGSGGGGDGETQPPTVSPGTQAAKSLFRNSNMTEENWKLIGDALEKILNDCMGGKLYSQLVNHLNGGTFIIELDPNSSNSGFSYSPNKSNSKITWGIKGNSPSNSLLHELFHGYQAYQVANSTEHVQKSLNFEIEARLAQYRYLSRQPEFVPGSSLIDRYSPHNVDGAMVHMSDLMDSNGNLIDPSNNSLLNDWTVFMRDELKSMNNGNNPYVYQRWDDGMTGMDNFDNLKTLSEGC